MSEDAIDLEELEKGVDTNESIGIEDAAGVLESGDEVTIGDEVLSAPSLDAPGSGPVGVGLVSESLGEPAAAKAASLLDITTAGLSDALVAESLSIESPDALLVTAASSWLDGPSSEVELMSVPNRLDMAAFGLLEVRLSTLSLPGFGMLEIKLLGISMLEVKMLEDGLVKAELPEDDVLATTLS